MIRVLRNHHQNSPGNTPASAALAAMPSMPTQSQNPGPPHPLMRTNSRAPARFPCQQDHRWCRGPQPQRPPHSATRKPDQV